MSYMIVRHYFNHENKVILRGLTLEEAQEHCSNPETSSRTCATNEGMLETAKFGPWFDGYTEE